MILCLSQYLILSRKPSIVCPKGCSKYKAEDIKSDPALTTDTKTYIQDNINSLKEELGLITSTDETIRDNSVNSCKQAFNDLYITLKIAETKIIQKQVKEDYDFTSDIANDDTDIIDDNTFIEETLNDLEYETAETNRLNDIKTKITLNA